VKKEKEVQMRFGTVAHLSERSLSAVKLIGWIGHSTPVFADGLENVGDSIPPDRKHPYGYRRSEAIAGLTVAFLLAASGLAICYREARSARGQRHGSYRRLHTGTEPPQLFGIRPTMTSVVVDSVAGVIVHIEPFTGGLPNR
jgi:divalent metal cation (Fe/Co/Zn/Cd) transporter